MTTSAATDLTCWYIHQRRLVELFGSDAISQYLIPPRSQPEHLLKLALLAAFKQAALQYIRRNAIDPLDKLLASPSDLAGRLFTHHARVWFRGLTTLHPDRQPRPDPTRLASGYAKLDDLRPGLRLEFNFHPQHLTSNSSWSELTGQKRKFLFGVLQGIQGNRLAAIPYIIGDLFESQGTWPTAGAWLTYRELHIDQLDTFEAIRTVRRGRTVRDLEPLRTISEHQIKAAFADIIGEAHIPSDWGGERSDLFSAVRHQGRSLTTAFAFKGPSKFQPMTVTHLGKNGDQINRLYTEPAELLVLQHCHEVTSPVRTLMRAFAQQIGNPRMYCVIDGFDTLRILRAYGKCGLSA